MACDRYTLCTLAAEALDAGARVVATCSRGNVAEVTGYKRDSEYRLMLTGRYIGDRSMRWQSVAPKMIQIEA